jgi:hypothetical protein
MMPIASRLRQRSMQAALVAVTVLIGAAQIRADDDPVEQEYLDYHRGIYAAILCEGAGLDQKTAGDPSSQQLAAAHKKLAQAIAASVGEEIEADRRAELIAQAKSDIHERKQKDGCGDPEIKRVLDIYHTELEPALAQ